MAPSRLVVAFCRLPSAPLRRRHHPVQDPGRGASSAPPSPSRHDPWRFLRCVWICVIALAHRKQFILTLRPCPWLVSSSFPCVPFLACDLACLECTVQIKVVSISMECGQCRQRQVVGLGVNYASRATAGISCIESHSSLAAEIDLSNHYTQRFHRLGGCSVFSIIVLSTT